MNLNAMMSHGVTSIMKTAGRYYLSNTKGRKFLAEMLPHIKRSSRQRVHTEASCGHAPVFLIASVASQCNLRCTGCYARSGGTCTDSNTQADLNKDEWDRVFTEASELGISFVLIAGGEPLMRHDVLTVASNHKDLIFPIFTNATMVDDRYLSLFDASRNLIPIVSIEGDPKATDSRRGRGTSAKIEAAMRDFKTRDILFGVSITVTSENIGSVLSREYLNGLQEKGCGAVVYVEYVPTEAKTEHLTLDESDLARLEKETYTLRSHLKNMVILSFPGDEEALGGCLASGRGFFHINPKGGAEPCPFSPYSKHNVVTTSLKDVLSSDYFNDLRAIAHKAGPNTGGCTLFAHEQEVQVLCAR